MTITLTNNARSGACNGTVDLIDVGSGTAVLRIRASTTALCNVSLPNPAFGAASNGVATAAGLPLAGTAIATGTADNFQVLDRDGTLVFSGSCTESGGGGDCIIDETDIVSGSTVTVTAWTHTQPA